MLNIVASIDLEDMHIVFDFPFSGHLFIRFGGLPTGDIPTFVDWFV